MPCELAPLVKVRCRLIPRKKRWKNCRQALTRLIHRGIVVPIKATPGRPQTESIIGATKPSGKTQTSRQGAIFIWWPEAQKHMARSHIQTKPAPAPFAYPANFLYAENGDYVKYGQPVFEGRVARGDEYWTAENITQTWFQAETGKIPISGAGYGGKFAGEGFDGIWLDMSEIVRPTRDGVHGRETISTKVDLGRFLTALSFDRNGQLASALPPCSA